MTTDRVATLAWQAPAACPQVFRVQIDERYPDGLAAMLRTTPEQSESFLAVAGPAQGGETWPPGPVPEDRVFVGRSLFRGPKTQGRPLEREFALSAALAGPASPDAPCFERTWDPVEDALALGWPALPGRMVAVGETWRGARVEARCNRSACVDPKTRGGGPEKGRVRGRRQAPSWKIHQWRGTSQPAAHTTVHPRFRIRKPSAKRSHRMDRHDPEHGE